MKVISRDIDKDIIKIIDIASSPGKHCSGTLHCELINMTNEVANPESPFRHLEMDSEYLPYIWRIALIETEVDIYTTTNKLKELFLDCDGVAKPYPSLNIGRLETSK